VFTDFVWNLDAGGHGGLGDSGGKANSFPSTGRVFGLERSEMFFTGNSIETALVLALKVNMPDFWRTHLAFAVAHVQLGEFGGSAKLSSGVVKTQAGFPRGRA
jgi:hypothetical protein